MNEKCFACGKAISENKSHYVITEDGAQTIPVGPECYRKVRRMDRRGGYQPPRGGPRPFLTGSKG